MENEFVKLLKELNEENKIILFDIIMQCLEKNLPVSKNNLLSKEDIKKE